MFDGGRGYTACIIRDLSEGGARLEVSRVSSIPNSFDLVAPGHRAHSCRVAWRALREIGVQFID